jgi:hypothetical protein
MSGNAKAYISLVSAAGLAAIAYAFVGPQWPQDLFRFCAYLLLSLLAATLKLRLPGLAGPMSIGFVLVLLSISELTLAETMLIACAGVVVQCLWRAKPLPASVQVLFSASTVAISVLLAYECSRLVRTQLHAESVPIVLAATTCLYFIANSLLVSGVLAMVKCQPLPAMWRQCYLFAFPYYLLGGAVAGLITASGREFGWKPALLILPVMGLIYLFYRFYFGRIEMLAVPLERRSGSS